MGTEMERKFLLWEDDQCTASKEFLDRYSFQRLEKVIIESGHIIEQGYLPVMVAKLQLQKFGLSEDFPIVEARLRSEQEKGTRPRYFFTVKGAGTLERPEKEAQITENQYRNLWGITRGNRLQKMRLEIDWYGTKPVIDWYASRILVTAEVEAKTLEERAILKAILPLGLEVTENPTYKNVNLTS